MSDPKKLDLQAEVERLAEKSRLAEKLPMGGVEEAPYPVAETLNFPVPVDPRRQAEDVWSRTIPRRFQNAAAPDMREESPEIQERWTDWVKDPAGRNLLLLGPVGTGKTHAAVAAARPLHFNRAQFVTFWPVVELLDQLRPGGTEGAMDTAMNAPVLILDDLGAEKPTEWTAERLYAIVNRRWLQELPTIATTNLPGSRKSAPKDYDGPTLDEALGPRMFSRLVGSGAVILRLSGSDRRR